MNSLFYCAYKGGVRTVVNAGKRVHPELRRVRAYARARLLAPDKPDSFAVIYALCPVSALAVWDCLHLGEGADWPRTAMRLPIRFVEEVHHPKKRIIELTEKLITEARR